MSTVELFINTIILCLLIGTGAGWLLALWLVARPLERQSNLNHARLMRTHAEREHRGTPYRPETIAQAAAARLAAEADNDRWSRKAPELRAVQTGRPV